MNLQTYKGAALLTVIIVIFILTILASVMLNLLSSQTRIVEHDISRVKSKYANEAIIVRQLELFRNNLTPETSSSVSGRYDDFGQNWAAIVTNKTIPSGSLKNLMEINSTIDYQPSF